MKRKRLVDLALAFGQIAIFATLAMASYLTTASSTASRARSDLTVNAFDVAP